jgi:hypothetical protein
MAHVIQDGEGPLPGLSGSPQFAGVMLGVTEMSEGHRFSWAVAELSGDAKCALVALGGLSQVAELVLGVAKAVPDISLENAVTSLRIEVE